MMKIHGAAKFISILVNIFSSGTLKSFTLADISFFPFLVTGLKFETKRLRSQPEVVIEIGHIKVETDVIRTIRAMISGKSKAFLERDPVTERMIYIEISNFSIVSKTLRFRDFLDPPRGKDKKKQEKANLKQTPTSDAGQMPSFSQCLIRLITVVFKNIDFNFDMRMIDAKVRVRGGAVSMIVYPTSSVLTPADMVVCAIMRGYRLVVHDRDEVAVCMCSLGKEELLHESYTAASSSSSNSSSIEESPVEVKMMMTNETASGTVRADMEMLGEHKAFIGVRPFLRLFDKYQVAEDDSIEIKMVREIDTLGKMNWIAAKILSSITMELCDKDRCRENIVLKLHRVEASIEKKPAFGEETMDLRLIKIITGEVGWIEFLGYSGSEVKGVKAQILKNIINTDDFIDLEEFDAHIDSISFPDTTIDVSDYTL
jgi:hypothetical protein